MHTLDSNLSLTTHPGQFDGFDNLDQLFGRWYTAIPTFGVRRAALICDIWHDLVRFLIVGKATIGVGDCVVAHQIVDRVASIHIFDILKIVVEHWDAMANVPERAVIPISHSRFVLRSEVFSDQRWAGCPRAVFGERR
jgi:hypothetical protein